MIFKNNMQLFSQKVYLKKLLPCERCASIKMRIKSKDKNLNIFKSKFILKIIKDNLWIT